MEKQHGWIGDIITKLMCGVCTILLSIAVNSLDAMKTEIKTLSQNVFELGAQSKVLVITISNIERRLDKLEAENDKLNEKIAAKTSQR